jgi:hypothetical protein
MPPAPFALVIFETGFHVYAKANLCLNPAIYTSYRAEMSSLLLVEIGSHELFAQTGLKPQSS